jgi:hypothetical protein
MPLCIALAIGGPFRTLSLPARAQPKGRRARPSLYLSLSLLRLLEKSEESDAVILSPPEADEESRHFNLLRPFTSFRVTKKSVFQQPSPIVSP